jgi:hypothetical protein
VLNGAHVDQFCLGEALLVVSAETLRELNRIGFNAIESVGEELGGRIEERNPPRFVVHPRPFKNLFGD